MKLLVIGGAFTQYDDQPHAHIARIYGGSVTGSGALQFTSAAYQVDETGGQTEKTIALPHADLLRVSRETGRPMDDPWCSRLAAHHLLRLVETGEDIEKDLVTVAPADLARYAASLKG